MMPIFKRKIKRHISKKGKFHDIFIPGTGLHLDGKSEWCHPFQLQPGSQVTSFFFSDTRSQGGYSQQF